MPTDEYLTYVHRGRSPAYAKIRNDTFRTLATDPLFKRRVTETSLIRLLNAVAWKLHDTQKAVRDRDRERLRTSRRQTGHGSPEQRRSIAAPPPRLTSFTAEDLDAEAAAQMQPLPNGSNEDFFSASTKSDETSVYVQGMNVLCAPFLYAARSEVQAFALFHHFITLECPAYVHSSMAGVHRGLALVDKVLAIVEPKLSAYLLSKGMTASVYAFASVLTFSACTPPLPEVLHLWDFLFAYGPHLNVLCIVAQLIRMRDRLLESASPVNILRSFPPLDAKDIISLTLLVVRKVPREIYDEVVHHAK